MEMLNNELVAVSVIVVVAGAIFGIVAKTMFGGKKEEKVLEEIAAKYADKSGGKKSKK